MGQTTCAHPTTNIYAFQPWLGSSAGWSGVPGHQGCRFSPGQGTYKNEAMSA